MKALSRDHFTMKRLLIISILGQVVYYIVLSLAWKVMGWQFNESHGFFLGRMATGIVLIVNPFLCAYCAYRITSKGKNLMVWLLYLFLVVISAAVSNTIFFYVSGYDHYWATYSGPNDIKAVTMLVNKVEDILGGVVSALIYIAIINIFRSRDKKSKGLS